MGFYLLKFKPTIVESLPSELHSEHDLNSVLTKITKTQCTPNCIYYDLGGSEAEIQDKFKDSEMNPIYCSTCGAALTNLIEIRNLTL